MTATAAPRSAAAPSPPDDPRLKDTTPTALLPRAARAGRGAARSCRVLAPSATRRRRPHPDLRDHGGRVEHDERLRRDVQLRPRRVLRHRCLHRRLPARRARDLAVDRDGRRGRARRVRRRRYRVPVPALRAGGRLLRAGDVRLRPDVPAGGAEPRVPAQDRGLQPADHAAGSRSGELQFTAGQRLLRLDPRGHPGAGAGRHDRLHALPPGAATSRPSATTRWPRRRSASTCCACGCSRSRSAVGSPRWPARSTRSTTSSSARSRPSAPRCRSRRSCPR